MPQRHRQNFIGGLIEDNPLASGATTITSAALAAVDEVVLGTTYIPIVLDPDGIGGAPEIAYITAHSTAATTATISRAEESTAAREHKQDIRWVHGPTSADFASDWALIDEIELASLTANITFSSIPDYWRDLVVVGEIRTDNANNADTTQVTVGNGSPDVGANYRYHRTRIMKDGTTAAANAEGANSIEITCVANNADAGIFTQLEISFFRYADSSRKRHVLGRGSILGNIDSATASDTRASSWQGVWDNTTTAIDTIRFVPGLGTNYVTGSYLSLYGRGERRNP